MSDDRLTPGMWCWPSSEGEWKAILGLAVELGVRGNDFVVTRYDKYPLIWFSRTSYGLVYPGNFSEQMSGRIPVPEFISRMYAEAEARKDPENGMWVDAKEEHRVLLSRLEALEAVVDGSPLGLRAMNDKVNHIRLRLEGVENALGEHLCKHRASGL